MKPDCATDAEWNDWIESDALYARGRKSPFCGDCTPEYKAKAESLGLCSLPETWFETVINEDGEIELIGRPPSGPLEPEDYEGTEEALADLCCGSGGELCSVPEVLRDAQYPDVYESLLAGICPAEQADCAGDTPGAYCPDCGGSNDG